MDKLMIPVKLWRTVVLFLCLTLCNLAPVKATLSPWRQAGEQRHTHTWLSSHTTPCHGNFLTIIFVFNIFYCCYLLLLVGVKVKAKFSTRDTKKKYRWQFSGKKNFLSVVAVESLIKFLPWIHLHNFENAFQDISYLQKWRPNFSNLLKCCFSCINQY